ncbi:acyl carrier protein-like protein, partial [Coemansia spiralis]
MFRVASIRLAALVSRARVAATVTAAPRLAINKPNMMPSIITSARWYSDNGGLSREKIESRIINLLQDFDKVNQEKLTPTADFSKDLGLDSLDTVEVVMAIEEEFSVEIPDDDADNISSVKKAIDYIAGREDA